MKLRRCELINNEITILFRHMDRNDSMFLHILGFRVFMLER